MRRAASPRLWPLCLLAFIRGAGSIDCFRDNFLRKDRALGLSWYIDRRREKRSSCIL